MQVGLQPYDADLQSADSRAELTDRRLGLPGEGVAEGVGEGRGAGGSSRGSREGSWKHGSGWSVLGVPELLVSGGKQTVH